MDRTNAAIRATHGGAQGLEPIYEAICQDVTAQLGCTRASVWLFNLSGDAIHCQCLLDRRETEFPAGMILTAASVPLYFDMICQDRPREWSEADILYMYQIANLLTLTFKYRGRVAA